MICNDAYLNHLKLWNFKSIKNHLIICNSAQNSIQKNSSPKEETMKKNHGILLGQFLLSVFMFGSLQWPNIASEK